MRMIILCHINVDIEINIAVDVDVNVNVDIGVDVNVTECSNQIMGDYQVFRIRDSMITPRYRVRYFISAIARCQSFLS